MKLVFLAPSFKTGGGNRVFIELANQLCDDNEVYFLYPNNSLDTNTFYRREKVKYLAIGASANSKIGKLKNMLLCIKILNRDFVDAKIIVSDPIFSLLIFLIRYKTNVYRFIQADDYRIYDDGMILNKGLLLKIYKKFCLRSYKESIRFIFNSHFVYSSFCKDSKRKDVECKLVYPAINHAIFKTVERESVNKCSLCLIARKHPLKGLETFIHVFHSLPMELKQQITSVTLVSHDDLSSFDTSGMKIIKPTCDDDIAKVYQSSDIFISTSWWEGFGLPPLEAMACGCAVITSKSGGVDEFAIDGENCLMFEPRNENELLERLYILIGDVNLRNRIALAGIKTAHSFDWSKSAEQFLVSVQN